MRMTKVSPNTTLTRISDIPTMIFKADMYAQGTAITEFSLYNVSPNTVATEKITDGRFLADPSAIWTVGSGWAWSNTLFRVTHTSGGGTAALVFNATEAAGDIYYLQYDIGVPTGSLAGTVAVTVGGVAVATESAIGSKAYVVKATGAGDLTFTPSDTFTGYITNVFMKKIGDADDILWTGAITGSVTDSKHDSFLGFVDFNVGCYALLTGTSSIGRVYEP